MDVEGCALLLDAICALQYAGERVDAGEPAVRDGVQVGEVEHRPAPGELGSDTEDVRGRAEITYAAHHLDAEGDRPVLAGEALPQVAKLLDDRRRCLLVRTAEQEAGVEDDELGSARR